MAVVLLIAISMGVSSGQKKAQSEAVTQTVSALQVGLEKFYSDQDRYPTSAEFGDATTMKSYFFPFLPSDFPSSSCTSTFAYKRPDSNQYQLFFCLPAVSSGYGQGWNSVSQTHK